MGFSCVVLVCFYGCSVRFAYDCLMIRPLLSKATHVGESGSQLHPCNCLGFKVTVVLQVLQTY